MRAKSTATAAANGAARNFCACARSLAVLPRARSWKQIAIRDGKQRRRPKHFFFCHAFDFSSTESMLVNTTIFRLNTRSSLARARARTHKIFAPVGRSPSLSRVRRCRRSRRSARALSPWTVCFLLPRNTIAICARSGVRTHAANCCAAASTRAAAEHFL